MKCNNTYLDTVCTAHPTACLYLDRCNVQMEDGEYEGEYSGRANHPTKGKEGCAEVQQLPHVETNLANATNAFFCGRFHLKLLFLCLVGNKGKEGIVLEEE